jgi:hypothetical protein
VAAPGRIFAIALCRHCYESIGIVGLENVFPFGKPSLNFPGAFDGRGWQIFGSNRQGGPGEFRRGRPPRSAEEGLGDGMDGKERPAAGSPRSRRGASRPIPGSCQGAINRFLPKE